MTEWKMYRLGDLCDTISDTYKGNAKSVVLINTSDVLEGKCLNHTKEPNQNLKGQFKKTFKQYDILYSEIRPANKRFAYIDFDATDYIASTKLMVLRHNEKIEPLYLYYILQSQGVIDELQMLAESRSGTFPQITYSELSRLEVKLPNRVIQKQILGILGAIDDKIENNRRINTNLELQAQALYKQWFVDFEFPNEEGKPYKSSGGKMVDSELGLIPEGWRVGTLSDLANVTMGQSPNGKSFNENGNGIVFYQGRTEFGVRYPSIRLYTTEPTRYAEPMSVLLSVRAPVGDINIATQRCCIGRGVASIKSKTDDNAYMYCCLKELRPQLDQYNGEGTVFGSINRKELEGLSLCVPKEEIITSFNNSILGMDKQMFNLCKENKTLATLRDTLLPKLMNGEIKI